MLKNLKKDFAPYKFAITYFFIFLYSVAIPILSTACFYCCCYLCPTNHLPLHFLQFLHALILVNRNYHRLLQTFFFMPLSPGYCQYPLALRRPNALLIYKIRYMSNVSAVLRIFCRRRCGSRSHFIALSSHFATFSPLEFRIINGAFRYSE